MQVSSIIYLTIQFQINFIHYPYIGDSRVTEQPQLTVMHTLWAREHNRVANVLVGLNPTWSNESVFQEARRIVVAELQHITYNEFLPNLLGINISTSVISSLYK